MSMLGKGLELQLLRCKEESPRPDFCNDPFVYNNVKTAYHTLWDTIDANQDVLASEVWSWKYSDGKYTVTPLGDLPPPPGTSPTEADVRQ